MIFEHTTEFLSANAQIFGALLGLVGLSFVRIAEAKERNVSQLAETMVDDFIREVKKLEPAVAKAWDDVHITTPEAMGVEIDKLMPHIPPDSHKRMRSRYQDFLSETNEMRSIRARFVRGSYLSAGLILASILGLLLPSENHYMSVFVLIILILSAVALVECVRFFLIIANTTMFLAYRDD